MADRELGSGLILGERYELLELIGTGHLGEVYRAREPRFGRHVAIKKSRYRQRGGEGVAEFLQEARAAGALRHPNIVTVHDFARAKDGTLYLVMEYLDGQPLAAVIRQENYLNLQRTGMISLQLCAGLEEAHRHGIVHQDLKPENVMLCQTRGIGELVKVLDFGLAQAFAKVQAPNKGFKGTPRYMSPEQALGHHTGPAADIYALGILIYEMLTGQPPFVSSDMVELVRAHVREAPKLLSQVSPQTIPPALEQLVASCLEKDPEKRPKSAGAVRQQLQLALRDRLEGASLWDSSLPQLTEPPLMVSTSTFDIEDSQEWASGELVLGRYQLQGIKYQRGVEWAKATDLAAGGEHEVMIRRMRSSSWRVRNQVDYALERWFEFQSHFSHEGLVAHHHHAWDGSHLVLVSEIPEGSSLESMIRSGHRMSVQRTISLVLSICETIQVLHDLRILHLDIRPQNIRIINGQPKLANISLWSLVDAGIKPYSEEELRNARRYKAPEQLGLFVETGPSPETDIYAIGLLLYELLTERTPFEVSHEQALLEAKLDVSYTMSQKDPDIPRGLAQLIERLIHPRASQRIRSVATLIQTLEGFLSGGQVTFPIEMGLQHRESRGERTLHGRSVERSTLNAAVEDCRRGHGRMIILCGEAGAGKSRLAQECAFELRRAGGWVFSGFGAESTQSTALEVVRAILADLNNHLAALDSDEEERILGALKDQVGAVGGLLRPYSSFLHELFSDCDTPLELSSEGSHRERLFNTLVRLFWALGRLDKPVGILIDDLQWIDSATHRVLEYLVPVLSQTSLLVVATARQSEDSLDATGLLLDRLTDAGAQKISLGGLEEQDVEGYLREEFGPIAYLDRFATILHGCSNGNPASILALCSEAKTKKIISYRDQEWTLRPELFGQLQPADSVVMQMSSRLAGLPARVTNPLAVAAVWGAPFDLGLLMKLQPTSERAILVAALAEGERAGLIRASTSRMGCMEFVHDSLREAACLSLAQETCEAIHRKSATLILSPVPESEMVERGRLEAAEHLLNCNLSDKDAPLLATMAEESLRAYAAEGALRMSRAALAAADKKDHALVEKLLFLQASALALLGKPHDAATSFAELINHMGEVQPNTDKKSRQTVTELRPYLQTITELAQVQWHGGALEDSLVTFDKALMRIDFSLKRKALARLARTVHLIVREVFLAGWGYQRNLVEHQEVLGRILIHKTFPMFFLRHDDLLLTLLEGLRASRLSGNDAAYVRALSQTAGVVVSGLGFIPLGKRLVALAKNISMKIPDRGRSLAALHARTMQLLSDGANAELDSVARLSESLQEQVDKASDSWVLSLHSAFSFEVLKELGDIRRSAELVLKQARLLGQSRDLTITWARQYGVWALVQMERPDLALESVHKALSSEVASKDLVLRGYLLAGQCVAFSALGEVKEAIAACRDFRNHGKEIASARRHLAVNYNDVLRAFGHLVMVSLGNKELLREYRKLVQRARKVVRGFPIYRDQMILARSRLMAATGRSLAARSLISKYLSANSNRSDEGSISRGELLEFAGYLHGGILTLEGRQRLASALEQMPATAKEHPLYHRLCEVNNVAHGGQEELSESLQISLVEALGLSNIASNFEKASTSIARRDAKALASGLRLVAELNRRLMRGGEAAIREVIHELASFTQCKQVLLYREVSNEIEVISKYLASGTRVGDHRAICQSAIRSGEPMVLHSRGLARMSNTIAAVPSDGSQPVLCCLLVRSGEGDFSRVEIEVVQAVLVSIGQYVSTELSKSPVATISGYIGPKTRS